ncbi:hypothetical protein ACT3UJ_06975 [Halomonas sp. 86]|uniref:hypothetical protein n=1 Tax=unclassified Halomonas TaxID=2609666 RepID=UPI004034C8FF
MNNWMKDNLSSVFNLFMIAAPSVYLVYLLAEVVINEFPGVVPHWFQIAITMVYALIVIGLVLAEIARRATEEANESYIRNSTKPNKKTH